MAYKKTAVEMFRCHGDVIEDVTFDWWLAGPDGAGFCLIQEPHHTNEDIKRAKRALRNNRDVVGRIQVFKLKEEVNA